MRAVFISGLAVAALVAVSMAGAAESPAELGAVRWVRDLDEGLRSARERGKPVLLLFSEVPG
jgi:hypothetical protein